MRIDQRNSGAAVTVNDGGPFTLDRWQGIDFTPAAFSVQQVNDAPAGFTNSLKVTTTTAGTANSTDVCVVRQGIEGFNVADLGFGSSAAQTITLSFRVKSSIAGTFGGSLVNGAGNRSYPFSYTINATNTWETKTITIAGDITGTWITNNGVGINLYFDVGSGTSQKGTAGSWAATGYLGATGSINLIGTLNATWQLTGVQLEVGSKASAFERRPYGMELQLAQRYCIKESLLGYGVTGFVDTTSISIHDLPFKTQMRAIPILSTSGSFEIRRGGTTSTTVSSLAIQAISSGARVVATASTANLTAGQGVSLTSSSASVEAALIFSAEL
jgi:hypothetical protein